MKALEADLVQAGLDDHQMNLLRQQHTHLRSEGRAAELGSLALRSRFINLDDLVDDESQRDSNVISQGQQLWPKPTDDAFQRIGRKDTDVDRISHVRSDDWCG